MLKPQRMAARSTQVTPTYRHGVSSRMGIGGYYAGSRYVPATPAITAAIVMIMAADSVTRFTALIHIGRTTILGTQIGTMEVTHTATRITSLRTAMTRGLLQRCSAAWVSSATTMA